MKILKTSISSLEGQLGALQILFNKLAKDHEQILFRVAQLEKSNKFKYVNIHNNEQYMLTNNINKEGRLSSKRRKSESVGGGDDGDENVTLGEENEDVENFEDMDLSEPNSNNADQHVAIPTIAPQSTQQNILQSYKSKTYNNLNTPQVISNPQSKSWASKVNNNNNNNNNTYTPGRKHFFKPKQHQQNQKQQNLQTSNVEQGQKTQQLIKKRTHTPYIIGAKTNGSGSIVRAINRFHFCVGKFKINTTTDQIKELVKEVCNGNEALEVEEIELKHDYHKLFRVCVEDKFNENMQDPAQWPEGIKIKRFFFPPKNRNKTSNSTNNAQPKTSQDDLIVCSQNNKSNDKANILVNKNSLTTNI